MHALAASLVVALTLSTSAFAQTKQTLTHELMWSFQRVGAPVPSPDGKWVVFSVAELTYDATKEVSDLWIVPADGHAAPRRLTSNKGSESGASWSADSSRLAFAAKRDDDEVAQIYVLEIGLGGEAQRATNTATAASAPKWSPDGKHLMFQAAMWPGATDEESNRKAVQERKNVKSKVRVYETFPIRNFDRWIDESKPHLWIVDVGRDKKARPLFAGSTLAGKAGYNGDGLSAAWAPDGESIVFAAADTADAGARAMVASSIWQVPLGGGEPKRIGAEGWDVSAPRFSPDGKTLCFGATDGKAAIYALAQIACSAWPMTGQPVRILAKDLDRPVGSWAFTPDSRTMYFTAEDAGHEHVYSVPVTGGAATRVLEAAQGVYTSLDIAARGSTPLLVANWESAVNPIEVVTDRSRGEKTRAADVVQYREGRVDRLAAASRFLVHRAERPAHSQLRRPAAAVRRDEEVSAAGADARRIRQFVARCDFLSLELSPARASRVRHRRHRLSRLDRLWREVRARHSRRSPERTSG